MSYNGVGLQTARGTYVSLRGHNRNHAYRLPTVEPMDTLFAIFPI